MSNGTRVNAPETALRWREESAKALPPNGWQRSARFMGTGGHACGLVSSAGWCCGVGWSKPRASPPNRHQTPCALRARALCSGEEQKKPLQPIGGGAAAKFQAIVWGAWMEQDYFRAML